MALDKQDLKEIKKIVDVSIDNAISKSEAKMSGKIGVAIEKSETKMSDKITSTIKKSEEYLVDRMDYLIDKSKDEIITVVDKKIEGSEARINANTNREVSDLARNDSEQIKIVDNHEHRIIRVERKLGIKS